MRWYGIFSLIIGYGMLPIYWTLEDYTYVSLNWGWFRVMQAFFLPVGMGWLMVSFFDGDFMRRVFKDLVRTSLLGPFFAYWYYNASYLLYSEYYEDKLKYWLWGAFFIFTSLLEAVIQILVVPGVYRWSEKSDYLDNDQEKSLLALAF